MSIATAIVDAAKDSMPDRIATALSDVRFGDWSDPAVGHRFVDVLRGFTFWVADDHTVVGMAPDTDDGAIWGFVVADVLDGASQDFTLSDRVRIDQVDDVTAKLTW